MRPFIQHSHRLGRSWAPISFSNASFARIPAAHKIEEETLPDYVASRYYPAQIGETLKQRYQIAGKLGFGTTSTVWLARDMMFRRFVTLKIYIESGSMAPAQLNHELNMYSRVNAGPNSHPGKEAVRSLLDSFKIDRRADKKHEYLVDTPSWENVWALLHRNPIQRLPSPVLAFVLHRLFLALDYLHTECNMIHTDIKADNIMFSIIDESVLTDFEQNELQSPSPKKEEEDRTIYTSRELQYPSPMGDPILCDFGSAVVGGIEHREDIQPNAYRALEVMLDVPWTYSVDIWNVGCMIWHIFEGRGLFTGRDPEVDRYRTRAHLAEVIDLIGPPPPEFTARGALSRRFFSEQGEFKETCLLKGPVPLEDRETTLQGEDKTRFLRMMRRMLPWEPEKRSSARELAGDEWILKQLGMQRDVNSNR